MGIDCGCAEVNPNDDDCVAVLGKPDNDGRDEREERLARLGGRELDEVVRKGEEGVEVRKDDGLLLLVADRDSAYNWR